MAYLFSLTDSSLYMEIPVGDSLRLSRRVISVETLEGTSSRDLGASAGDLTFSFQAKLDSDTLNSLAGAAAKGLPLGLSIGSDSYEVLIRKVEAGRLPDKNHSVKIDMAVARSLDPEPIEGQI